MTKIKQQEHPKPNVKKTKTRSKRILKHLGYFLLTLSLGIIGLGISLLVLLSIFDQKYQDKVYPGVSIAGINFSNQTKLDIINHWLNRNHQFQNLTITFEYQDHIATLSAQDLDIGFDATLSATQAIDIGRSGSIWSQLHQKYTAWKYGINLSPFFRWQEQVLDDTISDLAQQIDIAPENALFEFENGRVVAFKPSKKGQILDQPTLKQQFVDQLEVISSQTSPNSVLNFTLPIKELAPLITTSQANNYGIKELIGKGESYYRGSIANRIYNLTLAASRLNGILIPSGQIFSFNQALGDISAATGYKQAYVIKQGRTILDDGGGVCQVSTTFFRAAMDTGLPIIERYAHSYRVAYYEQGGWQPGFDATIFAPKYDLKVKNDTPAHILIQAYTLPEQAKLVFEFYGTNDGRESEISPARLWDARPAPPPLYQDDPTLPQGTEKQIDWASPGIKSEFDYTIRKNGQVIFEKSFYSNFIPWQAVYLRGTGT